jgi:hypothetical protein
MGFQTVPEDAEPKVGTPATRHYSAIARTGSHPTVGGRSGTNARVGGQTGTHGRVGGQTGMHGRVGGQTGMHGRVGGRSGTHGRVGGRTGTHARVGGRTGMHPALPQTQMLPRVGATSQFGAIGSITGRSAAVRGPQRRREPAIDPALALLGGIAVFFGMIILYAVLRPPQQVAGENESKPLSFEEQNRLARVINSERAEQARLLYRDPAPATQPAAAPTLPAREPNNYYTVRVQPGERTQAAETVKDAPALPLPSGGIITGMVDNGQSIRRTPPSQGTGAADTVTVVDDPAVVIPPKPRLPMGGIAAGALSETELAAQRAQVEAAKPKAPAVPPPAFQRSKKDAPHGGAMYEAGPGVALLELTLDRHTGELFVYVMDPVQKTRLMVRDPMLELQVPAFAQTFTLRAQRSASAQFSGQFELLRDNRDPVRALIPVLNVNGHTFRDLSVEF